MDYKAVIESSYDRVAWQQLLHDIFRGKVTFRREPATVQTTGNIARVALFLGKISLTDGESIAVYEVELSDNVQIERNRRGIRDLLVADWRNAGYAGAFMFCYRKNESTLRFSYVSETWGFDKQGKYEKISTDTRRYTYLLGAGRACRTAIDQFTELKNSKLELGDVTKAFSVEVLTKQFYNDLFEWFQWATSPASGITFPNNTAIEEDDREDIETKIIRMITRIMFVWFIKQKDLVPERIFDPDYLGTILKDFDAQSPVNGNFYNAILQNLFFATLNRAIVDENGEGRRFAANVRKDVKTLYRYPEMFAIGEKEVVKLFSEVPFLNGGLFECLDKTKTIDGVERAFNYDGFSRNDKRFPDGRYRNRAIVPNLLFFESEKGLISILGRYNFTIEENTPEEQQVALDPELLGKVFENLLGAYNPETRETARNNTGSFYTPREIVNYMVDESLIAYLGDTELVRSLFDRNSKLDPAREAEYLQIATRLKALKILDPACGSGAFPMGLLNRMVDILQRILPNESPYELKLAIIENCIYGCDIQCIAAQITKLRFFISLICDCQKDASKPNFGIPTLPNLETKFVAANSLIAKKKHEGNLFENPEIARTKEQLIEVRHRHFSAKNTSKKVRLREEDQRLRSRLASLLADDNFFPPEDATQLAAWNPYDQNTAADFFDPEWMFGISDGFDIIVSNPPYIQLQNNRGALARLYEDCEFETFARTGDIYCLFYERGWQLLKEGGHLCYITSNKWMRAGYGEKTRHFFAQRTNPRLLVDFAGVKVFESATVDTNILLFAKSANEHKTVCAVANKQNKDSVRNLGDFVRQHGVECSFNGSDAWVILSPIEESIKRKIEAVGTPLKDWDIQINYGIKTGYNPAFIVDSAKREEILSNCQTPDEYQRTDELIRPILRGRDIKRYGYDWAGLWLIATFPSRHYDIDDFPATKHYLLTFARDYLLNAGYDWVAKDYLEDFCKQKLSQTGDFIDIKGKRIVIDGKPEKARKKTGNKWFETQDSIGYWDLFFQPKICWKAVGRNLTFAIIEPGIFLTAPASFISAGIYNMYILGVLCSQLGKYYIYHCSDTTGAGDIMLNIQSLVKFPIPKNDSISADIKQLVHDLCNGYTDGKQERLNNLIYEMYGFDSREISEILRT